MKKLFKRLIPLAFFVLVAFAPSGTRYIWRMGNLAGHDIEPGTISLFAMQLVAIAYVALVFLTRERKDWRDLFSRPETVAAVALAAICLGSSFVSDDVAASLVAALSVALAIAVFLAILMHRPDPHENLVLFAGAALFQVGFGLWQFFSQSVIASKWLGMAEQSGGELGAFVVETASGRWLRSYGQLSHPNVYGTLVVLGIIACIGLAGHRSVRYKTTSPAKAPGQAYEEKIGAWAKTSPLRYYAFMPFLATGLLFSFSRTAFVAGVAGACWLALSAFATPAAPGVRRVFVPAAIIISVTLAIIGTVYVEPLTVRATAVGRLEERSISDRFVQVSDAVQLFLSHPLFGTGLGRMPYRVYAEVDSGRDWWRYDYVHDVPLLAAAETGVFGLLAWIACVIIGLRAAWRRLRHRTRELTGTTAFAACFIALVVAGLFDHFLWTSWFGLLIFWIVLGMRHVSAEKAERK